MNKREQAFCTKLGAWLKTTKHPQSMLIECKVSPTRYFKLNTIRPAQYGALNRILEGLPLVHKISDGAVGSKLVDMIYIAPTNEPIMPMVAIYCEETKQSHLYPYWYIDTFKTEIKSPTMLLDKFYITW